MPRHRELIDFTVAWLGDAYRSEIQLPVSIANATQDSFRFVLHRDVISIQEDKYKLKNGALDLDKAVRDLLRRRTFKQLAAEQLILVTSKPYSDQDTADNYANLNLEGQCYYFEEGFSFTKNISLISTYIWDRLPSKPGIPITATPTRHRALEPYLLLAFAAIALNRLTGMRPHEETRGCLLDYCDDVRDIDRFFEIGHLCDQCERTIQIKRRDAEITLEQIDSVKKLLGKAIGREYKYDVAISFAGSERELAERLAAMLRDAGFKVFYDDFYPEELVGKNLTDFFDEVYRKNSRFCLILVSREYERRIWTTEERQRAQARAREEMGNDYIIPILVEDADLSGILKTTGYLSLEKYSLEQIAQIVIRKLQRILSRGAATESGVERNPGSP